MGFNENLDWRSHLGLWRELCLELRENPQSQQADLREKKVKLAVQM